MESIRSTFQFNTIDIGAAEVNLLLYYWLLNHVTNTWRYPQKSQTNVVQFVRFLMLFGKDGDSDISFGIG
jgi:hypothetical protein